MFPNTTHCGWFQMHHYESLKKASFIATGLLLCLVTEPSEQIMLRFNLRELGDLAFISKAGHISFNATKSDYGAALESVVDFLLPKPSQAMGDITSS